MLALLRKDVNISRFYIITSLIAVWGAYAIDFPPKFFYIVIMYGFATGIFYYDETSKINAFLVSLPIKRYQIVLSRYLFTTFTGLIYGIYFIVLELLFQQSAPGFAWILFISATLIIIAITLPLFYLFNYLVAFMVSLILFLIFFTAFTLVIIPVDADVIWFHELGQNTGNHIIAIFSGIAVPLLVLSYFLSVWIISKKDLSRT